MVRGAGREATRMRSSSQYHGHRGKSLSIKSNLFDFWSRGVGAPRES